MVGWGGRQPTLPVNLLIENAGSQEENLGLLVITLVNSLPVFSLTISVVGKSLVSWYRSRGTKSRDIMSRWCYYAYSVLEGLWARNTSNDIWWTSDHFSE